jgi:hypothetical protein
MWKILSISAFVLLFFSSCEEEECVGCNLNPKIKIDFEPVFSLELTDSLLFTVQEEMELLLDSLNGDDLSNEAIEALESRLMSLRSDSVSLGDDFSLFRSGSARIDAIFAPGSKGLEQLQDTVIRDFALPINMQTDTTTFYFSYHTFTDTLQVYYHRDIIQSLDGMRMLISDIGVSEELTTFDSVSVKCSNRKCSNDRTTIFVYF